MGCRTGSCTKSTASSSVAADLRELRCGRRSWGELFFLLQNQHRQWCSRVDAWTSAELNMPQLNYLAMWWPGIYIYKHYIVVSNLSICLSIYLSITGGCFDSSPGDLLGEPADGCGLGLLSGRDHLGRPMEWCDLDRGYGPNRQVVPSDKHK